MNILIVTQYFWPENFRINDLTSGLKERGYNVTVLTGIPNYPDGHFFSGYGVFKRRIEDYNGIKVVRVPLLPRGNGGPLGLMFNYLSFALIASILGPLYCRDDYDLIFVYEPSPVTVGLPAIIFKKIKKVPLMFWVQDLWPESLIATNAVQSKRILIIVEKIVRMIYSKCDKILVQSKAFYTSIEKLGIGREKILYYPNSAESFYRPVSVQEVPECAQIPKGFWVMFAGNIGAAQDFGTILAAAELLRNYRDIHWVIIGDGRMRKWVNTEVKSRGLSETFHLLGSYPAESMPVFFAMAAVLLVSLKKMPIFALTIPAKVQSYLACAKPIICSLDGEGARIVEEANAGFVCKPEDPDALATAVLKAYRLPEKERQALGSNGRAYFKINFDREKLLDQLDAWVRDLNEKR